MGRERGIALFFGIALVVCFFLPWVVQVDYPRESLHVWEMARDAPPATKLNGYYFLVAGLVALVLSTEKVSEETRATGLVLLGVVPVTLAGFVSGRTVGGAAGVFGAVVFVAVIAGLMAICVGATLTNERDVRIARGFAIAGAVVVLAGFAVPLDGKPVVAWLVLALWTGGPFTALLILMLMPLLVAALAVALALARRESLVAPVLRRILRSATVAVIPAFQILLYSIERSIDARERSYYLLYFAVQWTAAFVWVSYGIQGTLVKRGR